MVSSFQGIDRKTLTRQLSDNKHKQNIFKIFSLVLVAHISELRI